MKYRISFRYKIILNVGINIYIILNNLFFKFYYMTKKIISTIIVSILSLNYAFATTTLSQELDSKGGTLKVNNDVTINYSEWTFNETVVFDARTVSQLEWWIDSSKFDDKWAEVIYLSFKNNLWLATIPTKEISFWYNNLGNYSNPVLITYKNNKLTIVKGEDNAWTYVFKMTWSIDWAYKIVDDLNSSSTQDAWLENSIDLLWSNKNEEKKVEEENIELNSATEENKEVLLSDKPVKGAKDYYLLILALILILVTFWVLKYSKNT